MVRICLLLVLCVFLKSCRVQVNQYGQPLRVEHKKLLKKNDFLIIPDSLYQKIDTLTLYKFVGYKFGSKMYKPNFLAFIRIFSDGKLVYSHGDKELSKEYFRPARGKQGAYFLNKKKQLTYSLVTSGEGYGYTYRGLLEVKNDSLIKVVEKDNYIEYYKKIDNLDLDWLNWQPDW